MTSGLVHTNIKTIGLSFQQNVFCEKYEREKEAAVAKQLQYYEAELQRANKEKQNAQQYAEELEQQLQQNTSNSNLQYGKFIYYYENTTR